ncbi:MAG TPA: 1-phosphofructokinase family hexose kinase [Methylothermaceae bacterium]|nr:1-phosphofructokinase family hexose kinase [Methylothermaceae bacterium]
MSIATLTLNPAVDVTHEIKRLIPDRKVHALATRYDPGGNGINVSRALKRLEVTARTFCVLAGETGQFLERLLSKHLDDPAYIHIPGETRINCTLLELEARSQYEVSGVGPYLDPSHLQELQSGFVQHVADGYGVVTGSVPPGVPDTIYADLVKAIRAHGGRPILDAHHELLRKGVRAGPFLVKPNRYEIEQLIGRKLEGITEVAQAVRQLLGQRRNIDYICVSLGEEGAILSSASKTWHAFPPKVEVRSTVGAGDTMVAGLVAGFVQGLEEPEILRLAVACSAGTVMQPGTELFDPADLPRLLWQVTIELLD